MSVRDCDRALLDAVNARIVAAREQPPLDRAREERLVAELLAANEGPLSEPGLRELFGLVHALTRREVARSRRLPSAAGRGTL